MEKFQDYELFKTRFYRLSNIDLNLYKEKQMKRRITSLIDKYGHSTYSSFLDRMKIDSELYNIFINYLTINVSEFFRNPKQWFLFENVILNEIFKDKDLSTLKIWSSACSTGDEPYTVAMILNKYLPVNKIWINASDIDVGAINKAKIGLYLSRSLTELPSEFRKNYFTPIGNDSYEISEDIKKCVDFKKLNLLEDTYPANMDIIICRNVLIYFTEEAKNIIIKRFSEALKPNGVLFLGNTEQIINYKQFNLKRIGTFFYQK